MNGFEWVKAWISGMSQLWLACNFADFNRALHRNLCCIYAEHILNTQTMLNIHRIQNICMTNEHIWMSESLNLMYEPVVAGLCFSRFELNSTQEPLLHICRTHPEHTIYHISTATEQIWMNKGLNCRYGQCTATDSAAPNPYSAPPNLMLFRFFWL